MSSDEDQADGCQFDTEANENRTSRTSVKRQRVADETALMNLVTRLLDLNERQVGKLELSDETLAALSDARKIKSYAARERQLRRIRQTLRDGEWRQIETRLDLLGSGQTSNPATELWVTRLLDEGDAALVELLQLFPDGDRGQLRQLLRNAQRAGSEQRVRARQRLARAVSAVLTHSV